MKRTELQRKTPLSRKGWPKGRSARRLVKRELGVCEICRSARATHRHHRCRRSQGGTDDPANLMELCSACHEYVHRNPAESYRQGYLLKGGKGVSLPSRRT